MQAVCTILGMSARYDRRVALSQANLLRRRSLLITTETNIPEPAANLGGENASAAVPSSHQSGSGVRSIGQTIGFRILIQGLNAGTGMLTARMLQPSGRGALAAITLWSGLIAGLTTLGLPSSLIYHVRTFPQRASDLLLHALGINFVVSVLACVVSIFFLPTWLHQYPPSAIHAAQWFILAAPLLSTTSVLRGALEASGAFTQSNLAQLLIPAITLIALLLLLATHRFDTFTAGMAYTITAIPVFALVVWQARDFFRVRMLPSLVTSRTLLSYGLRSYGIDLLGTLALQVDQVLVVHFLTSADLGLYVVTLSLSRMLNVFQNSVVMVLFPRAAGREPLEALALTSRAARVSLLITGLSAAFVALAGPALLRIFYGKAYARSSTSLRLLLVEVTISGCVFVLAQMFMALGRPGTVTVLQGIGLGLSVPLMIVLIPRYGINGAAASLLISTCFRFAFMYFSFRWVLKLPLPSLLPRREDLSLLLSALNRPRTRPA